MKATIIFLAIILSFNNRLTAQTRTIYGHVIAEDLGPIPGVSIRNKDELPLGTTGKDGRFNIDIPQNTQTILLRFIGFDRAIIKLNGDCDTIEIVMMESGSYDFMSSRKVDRLRLEKFNKLPGLYLEAYNRGIFVRESSCYSREFEPIKQRLDSIGKAMAKEEKRVKLTFERLTIGDTIKIPFSGESRSFTTNAPTLSYYSSFMGEGNYNCIIKCVITAKNKHKRGYNLVCKVVNNDLCKYPSVINGRLMKIGEVFVYNMRYFKIVDE